MTEFPPPILVETWLHILNSKGKSVSRKKNQIKKKVKEHFGSIELAKLYIEQSKDEEIEIHFL